jgi:CRP/FNR family transcriptional regulator
VDCSDCKSRPTCLVGGLPPADLARVTDAIGARRRVRRGQALYDAGDAFRALYAIRSGFFKTRLTDPAGRELITGFAMGGELLGADGAPGGHCASSAIALEDSEVCALPYALLQEAARTVPALQRRLHAELAREIARGQGIMLLLGTMAARERLAAFLLNLSRRFVLHGYAGAAFELRMTRGEIGSHLGMKIETVSRLFTAMGRAGLLRVEKKQVRDIDLAALERLLEPCV